MDLWHLTCLYPMETIAISEKGDYSFLYIASMPMNH